MRHWRRLLLHAVLSALFLGALLLRIDVPAALRQLRTVDPAWLTLAVGVFGVSRLVQAYRWRLFLWHRRSVPVGDLLAIHLIGTLVNTVLPLRVGDVVRVQLAGQRLRLPRAELTATVFVVETLMDWLTAALLLAAGSLFLLHVPLLSAPTVTLIALLVTALVLGTSALARLDISGDLAARRPWYRLPPRLRRLVGTLLPRFVAGLAALRDPVAALRAILISLLVYLVETTMYWCLGQAFGLDLAFTEYFGIMIGANLVLAVPLTPWNVGPFELAVLEVATLLGVERAVAESYVLGAHLVLITCINAAGIIALWALNLGVRDLLSAGTGREQSPA